MRREAILLAAALCLTSACAFNKQTVNLAPTVSVTSSNVGAGKELVLIVVDERPKQIIGHRGAGAYGAAAEITSNQDVDAVVREKLRVGLVSNGFQVVSANNKPSPSLKVEIRLIEYTTSTGFSTLGIHIRAAFKGICRNGTREYENIYRQENEERVMIVPTAETNEEWINGVVGQALEKIFQDGQLIGCLAA